MANQHTGTYSRMSEADKDKTISLFSDTKLNHDERLKKVSEFLDLNKRQSRKIISKIKEERGIGVKKEIEDSIQFKDAQGKKHRKKKFYLVTWCQNATPIHNKLLENMETYAKFLNADIHVIAGRYKNPTSTFAEQSNDWWDGKILKYLDANRQDLNNHITLLSDVKTQPTAVNPLSGFDSITMEHSCVIGHPKMHLKAMPVKHGYNEKILLTTGAISEENYTDSKAGKKAEFHHHYGFVIIEIENKDSFHIRQVTANKDGSFNDLFFNVDGEVNPIDKLESITLGDIHVGEHNNQLILDSLPFAKMSKNIILHDVFNCKSVSHHNTSFQQIELAKTGRNILQNELDATYDWLNWLSKELPYTRKYVIQSNHDEHLDKWLERTDFKRDIINAQTYLELANLKASKGISCMFEYLIYENTLDYKYVGLTDILNIKGVEHSLHGDKGSNGSRGFILQFSKLNTKVTVGHSHSPFRYDGAFSVGGSTKRPLDYQKGGTSSGVDAHVIQHNTGKRQHILYINGKFTILHKKYEQLRKDFEKRL